MGHARKHWKLLGLALFASALLAAAVGSIANGASSSTRISFNMIRSATVDGAHCLPNARAEALDESSGPVETLTVNVHGLPANTEFDFFVIQVPNGPFGLSWFQETSKPARTAMVALFVGRFSIETFIVAPGSARAPDVHH